MFQLDAYLSPVDIQIAKSIFLLTKNCNNAFFLQKQKSFPINSDHIAINQCSIINTCYCIANISFKYFLVRFYEDIINSLKCNVWSRG